MASTCLSLRSVLFALGCIASVTAHDVRHAKYDLRPFKIDLSSDIPRMLDLIGNTSLPKSPEYPGVGSTAGISLNVLENMRDEWLTSYDWDSEQTKMNELVQFLKLCEPWTDCSRFNQHLVDIEGQTVHFLYEKSGDPNAIPLLLAHGWPGSFIEFLPVIKNLTKIAKTSTGTAVSFDVVVPSLPGYAFSSPQPEGWTLNKTGRIWNTLMTDMLG